MGQINFDGKLMKDLGGFGKVNILAVVLVKEIENKLLCIARMKEATGKVEAEKVIIACGFDTTSSNTGIHKGGCVTGDSMSN